ncbi:MAG TPA: hypothetical protein VK943_07275 [Arenibaculum sp.]|nr:hypothetical protein [Arenibaculum sp.]
MTTRFERRGVAVSVVLLGMVAGGSGGTAAVLPYADPLAPPASMRAGLLAPKAADVAGPWVGRTPDGQVIAVTLRMDAGHLAGDATLEALVPQVRGRQPLARPEARGTTVSFEVKSTPCAKALARGVMTIVSRGAAHLSLEAGSTPISVRLSRVS